MHSNLAIFFNDNMQFCYSLERYTLLGKQKIVAKFDIYDSLHKKTVYFYTLDGFSKESFNQGLEQLTEILASSSNFKQLMDYENLLPSVYFFTLNCNKIEKEFKTKTAGLVLNPTYESLTRFFNSGFTTLKLKYKKLTIEDIKLLNAFIETAPQVKLRLDFNQKLNLDNLQTIIRNIPEENLDYIEEPFENCLSLTENYPNKIALDETLRNLSNIPKDLPAVFVIKPLLTSEFSSWIKELKNNKKRVIISSSFELPCGIRTLQQIIHSNKLEQDYHGIDTLRYYDLLPTV